MHHRSIRSRVTGVCAFCARNAQHSTGIHIGDRTASAAILRAVLTLTPSASPKSIAAASRTRASSTPSAMSAAASGPAHSGERH
jgi:hypothetical protein